jgi:hypothetical protein
MSLTQQELVTAATFGAVGWAAAAGIVRVGKGAGLFERRNLPGTFAFGAVAGAGFVWALPLVTKLPASKLVPAAGVATGVASVLDGVAITWAPGVYGSTRSEEVALPAALILWGAGWGLLYAAAQASSQ